VAGILAWMIFDYIVFNWYKSLFYYSPHLRDRICIGCTKYREEHKFIDRVESGRESFVTSKNEWALKEREDSSIFINISLQFPFALAD